MDSSGLTRKVRGGVQRRLETDPYRDFKSTPQVTYSGQNTVEFHGDNITFKPSIISGSRSATPSPRMTTELKIFSDKNRQRRVSGGSSAATSRTTSPSSGLPSRHESEVFEIMQQRPTPQELILTYQQPSDYNSWRVTETVPRRKGILMGTGQFEVPDQRRYVQRRSPAIYSAPIRRQPEITQWEVVSDSGVSDTWDLADTSRYSVDNYYVEDPLELILTVPQPSLSEKRRLVTTTTNYDTVPWHVRRLKRTNTPMELFYEERMSSPLGYKRYLSMVTPPIPERREDRSQEIDLIRRNDLVKIQHRNEAHGIENGQMKSSYEENSTMEPAFHYKTTTRSLPPARISPIPIRAPIWRSPPTPPPPSPPKESYHEDNWVVYHTVPYYIPQVKYEAPILPKTSKSRVTRSEHLDVVSAPISIKPPRKEVSYSEISESKQGVRFVEEDSLPDYFYYQYQTPKKKRIVDKGPRAKTTDYKTSTVTSTKTTKSAYEGFPPSLQILLDRYSRLQQKNKRKPSDHTLYPISSSLHETIKIDEDENKVGDMSMIFDVHEKKSSELYSETFNTVNEKVTLNVSDKKAVVEVMIQYELYTPLDISKGEWFRKRVIVTRVITLDLQVSKETRKIFNELMERALPNISRAAGKTVRVTGSDAYGVYNSLMAIVEEEEEKMDPQGRDTVGLDTIPQYIEAAYDQNGDSALYY